MLKNNVPVKVAIGYGVVAAVFILAIYLVYSNTQSIININKSSQEYSRQRDVSDSLMASLLKQEQINLQQLTLAYQKGEDGNFIYQKVNKLNSGKDSVMVHPTATQTHEAQKTTVEVVKTRKGFFRRLADAFKKEHTDTLSIKQDSSKTTTDSITPVDVADKVADVLEEISKEEKKAAKNKDQAVSKGIENLQMVNAQLALRSNQQLNDLRQKEKAALQQALDKAVKARKSLILQISLLAIVAMTAALVLLIYIWRDTKKERIYRENLERAKEETQRIMEQRERLLLTITHDIKAPAASISGFIDLLKEYTTAPEAVSCLNNIRHSAQHLSQLVAALLDYHQLENGLMELHPVSFNLRDLITHCVESMRFKAEEKGLPITCQIKTVPIEGSPKASIMCRADAFRIRQVMDNLISNAIKYTQQGRIDVMAKIEQQESQHQLIVMIKDTGCGMTTEECQKVFHAFTRLKESQGIEGVGLGLSITHELVTLLKGEILLHSEKGKGTTFTVILPIELSEEIVTPTVKQHRIFQNHKILILDDDPLQLQLLQEILKRTTSPWEIFACNHVGDALHILHNEQPALMMMDIEMPEMNGIDFIQHVNHSNMTVVAMTAHDASILPQLTKAGFDDCLFKPFDTEKLGMILGEEIRHTSLGANKNRMKDRFAPLLAFAEDDHEAEIEILSNLRDDLEKQNARLNKLLLESLTPKEIAQIAHKLMPVASMLHFASLPDLHALTPEQIQQQNEAQIRQHISSIHQDLENTLKEINALL